MKNQGSSQRVLKSIEPQEQILMAISKRVSGQDLGSILNGLEAFTKCFDASDQYKVDIKVEKIIEPISEDKPNKT
jgi:hypothetical protein